MGEGHLHFPTKSFPLGSPMEARTSLRKLRTKKAIDNAFRNFWHMPVSLNRVTNVKETPIIGGWPLLCMIGHSSILGFIAWKLTKPIKVAAAARPKTALKPKMSPSCPISREPKKIPESKPPVKIPATFPLFDATI